MGQELRKLLSLAWPVVLGQLGFTLMGVVDIAMVGSLGEIPLAALAAGNMWSFATLIPGLALMMGLDPVFAQAHGAENPRAMGRALARALVLAAGSAPFIILLHVNAEAGLRLLQQPEQAIPIASEYTRILALGVPGMLLFQVLRQYLQAMGRTGLPTVAVVVGNLVNVVLNLGLIHGRWGFPALGAVGSGWATTAVRFVLPLVLLALSWKEVRSRWPVRGGVITVDAVWALFRQAAPVSGHITMEVWAFNCVGVMIGWLGTAALAGHSLALTLSVIAWMVIFGLAAAASTRIGNLIGAGRPWVQTGWIAVGLGLVVMGGSAAVLASFPAELAALFTPDPAVIAVAVVLIPLAAIYQVFDGIQGVISGVLRGAGDVRVPAMLAMASFWGVGVPCAWWFGIHTGGGPAGVWTGLVAALVCAALALLARLVIVGRRGVERVDLG